MYERVVQSTSRIANMDVSSFPDRARSMPPLSGSTPPSYTTRKAMSDLYGVRWSYSTEHDAHSPLEDSILHPSFDTAEYINAYVGCVHFNINKLDSVQTNTTADSRVAVQTDVTVNTTITGLSLEP